MTTALRWGIVVVVAAAALMLLPGNSAVGLSHAPVALSAAVPTETMDHAAAASGASSGPLTIGQQNGARLRAALDADHVPGREQLLPSADPGVTVQDGMITPSTPLAPEPMGVGFYGVTEEHGKNVASISYAHGVEGVLNVTDLNLLYLDSYGPDEYTAQLNSVAVDVTLQQSAIYQFWTQNVFYYYQSSHTLYMADAIVNFTSSAFNVPYGEILGGNGYLAAGFGYFDPFGPAVYAPEPFTVAFFTNLTVVNDHPAVYFNYSVTSSAGNQGGSFDMVEFNSTVATPAVPAFQIDGEALGDTGYIPNDVELILGGNGGGSTTSALNASGTMNIYIQPNGTSAFEPVPSAWDFGSETGETIEGIGEWASGGSNPTVHFGRGPGVQQPLWGVKGAPAFGEQTFTLLVDPANAFVFVSLGCTFNASAADWANVPSSGVATYELPPGMYSFEILLSEYNPITLPNLHAGTHSVDLSSNPSLGIYTPLWAHANWELPAVSYPGGTGTVSNPYVLDNGPGELLNPLFGQFNDYAFPVFPGILLAGISDYVTITDEPSFEVPFTLLDEQFFSGMLPLNDELGWGFYAADNISIVDNPSIGGWLGVGVYGGASLVMWNSSHDLVAGNTFPVPSVGIILYGGTTNVLWGNVFSPALPTAPDPDWILNFGTALALYLYESGDLVYNNYFGTPETAFTPAYNPYNPFYEPELWSDHWNEAKQPATNVRLVNGWKLSGNILGLSYQGGNFWSNYGTQDDPYGVLPYNNAGQIVVGGDFVPLEPFLLYEVTFTEKGLPSGTQWNVTLNGIEETSRGKSIHFWDPSGIYAYSVTSPSSFVPKPAAGTITVATAAQTRWITWT